jgi:hypothetical protein
MAAHNSPKISNTSFKFVVPGRRKVAFLALVIRVSALIQINAGGDGEASRWRDARCGRARFALQPPSADEALDLYQNGLRGLA